MFNKDGFSSFVGSASGSSYTSGLKYLEEKYGVDIDAEYKRDKCTDLLQKLERDKRSTDITDTEAKRLSDITSHLKKYIEYYTRIDEMSSSSDDMTSHNNDETFETAKITNINKNTILYGPPGTGKTYNTAIYAVAIIENKNLSEIKNEDYNEVFSRYNKYKSEGLIEFTTFHQSYGYEEFIEGIKPILDNTDDKKDIQYIIESGLFKSFCDKILEIEEENIGLNESPTIWKVVLKGTGDNDIRKDCMENGHIRVSYGDDPNHTDSGESEVNDFESNMKIGDIVLSRYEGTTIDAIGVITGDFQWHEEYTEFKRLRKVKWLVKGINEDITKINSGKGFNRNAVGRLPNIELKDVMDIIAREKKKNYVFIIDEINRGNISKIFGELITLIEPSKRISQSEEMRAKLPYSQKLFGVPDNVYILGTMNTADRSIAAIDTALRRRFHFKEMMPNVDVLKDISIEGISISEMLTRMNKRISVLYDREHTIGHAYFISLRDNPTIEMLSEIFENAIIPLLQEYFYEDYEKIRLVLGDNNKVNKEEQFIIAVENDYNELFGNADIGFDDSFTYEINTSAFSNIEAYRYI